MLSDENINLEIEQSNIDQISESKLTLEIEQSNIDQISESKLNLEIEQSNKSQISDENINLEVGQHNPIQISESILSLEIEHNNIDQISKSMFDLDQDTIQRINVCLQFILEMYRVITSSLLILFVPQLCDDHICTISENLVFETNTYNTALCFNFISMFVLVIMYYIELIRENRMIKYLSVNPNMSNDNDNIGERLEQLSINKQNKIHQINYRYKIIFYIAAIIYLLNILLSLAIVTYFYAGSQTASTFITYILFMATKFNSVYSLISTNKNIFYSAYMKTNVQFNDIDPDLKLIN